MNANNGWPGKPGVPLNPEKDGWHWLLANTNKGPQPEAAFWDSRCFAWFCQGIEELTRPEKMMNYGWLGYLGPCLTPDEAAKREDVKWHEGYAVGVLDVRRGTAFGEPDTHYAALQKRIAELEAALAALQRDASQEIATDEMVRRLQHLGDWQAADRIEALQKRVAELEVENAALRNNKTEEEALREMMRDPRYWRHRDPEWVNKVRDGFRKLIGGKDE